MLESLHSPSSLTKELKAEIQSNRSLIVTTNSILEPGRCLVDEFAVTALASSDSYMNSTDWLASEDKMQVRATFDD